jgi:signal peptidase I
MSLITSLCIVLIIIYVYYIQFYKISCPQIFADDLIKSNFLKTGDLMLFKAYDNYNSIVTTCYFGHIGVIVIDEGIPMLFEAANDSNIPKKPDRCKNGIYYTNLYERIKKYKGRCFWRSLNKSILEENIAAFHDFINYAKDTFYYEKNIISSWFRKLTGSELCNFGTNCAELTFLSLIKLGLLNTDNYTNYTWNYLKKMCSIRTLDNGYKYSELFETVVEPFDY